MKVKVLFFGLTHELTGLDQEQVEIPEGESLEALCRRYESRFPRLSPMAGSLLMAVNQETVDRSYPLRDGDELAVMPPVSGGARDDFYRLTREPIPTADLTRLEIGETSVAIVMASAHRRAAFEACIDLLKRIVPIWKKEYFEDGAVWAEGEGQTRVLIEPLRHRVIEGRRRFFPWRNGPMTQ